MTKPFKIALLFKTVSRWIVERPAEEGDSEAGDETGPAPTSPKDPPILGAIDKAFLNDLRILQREGEPDVVGELITLYLAEASNLIKDLDEVVWARDPQGIRKAAHKLKSSSANLGATNFASLLKQAEIMGIQNQTKEAAELLPEIHREYEAVRKGFEAELAAGNAGGQGIP